MRAWVRPRWWAGAVRWASTDSRAGLPDVIEPMVSSNNQVVDFRRREHHHSRAPTEKGSKRRRRVLLTCEHASNELPAGLSWGEGRLKDTHWAYDPGARELTLELAEALQTVAVLSTISRLFVDVNRPPGADTLCRAMADGVEVPFNADLTEEERLRRMSLYWLPYHMALGRVAKAVKPDDIVSCHSFTEDYQGERRDFTVGVLCTSGSEAPRLLRRRAVAVADAASAAGFDVRLNEPWSGEDGFMYSADSLRISTKPGRRNATMLEVRNDVLCDEVFRRDLINCLLPVLQEPVTQ